ncbi:galanin peptides-like isoform X2 [Rhinoraja longicauda]
MPSAARVCSSLLLCALAMGCLGSIIPPKDRRGWTLNSAGYLLGPHVANGHRSLMDKPRLAGKRDTMEDGDGWDAASSRDALQALADFLVLSRLRGGEPRLWGRELEERTRDD